LKSGGSDLNSGRLPFLFFAEGLHHFYRATRDLFLAQRFARHASPLTTVIYTHPGDDEMRGKLRGLTC
jgi:hypothetical protein